MGLPEPHYSTLHKSQAKLDKDELGAKIMNEATVILLSMGIKEALDPIRVLRTNICPEYTAPKILPTCQKDVERQEALDREAEIIGKSMHVSVMKSSLSSESPLSCAIDGSGEGLSGPGLYFEHIWKLDNRRFVKQHSMLDLKRRGWYPMR
jgi:hypothetical protein